MTSTNQTPIPPNYGEHISQVREIIGLPQFVVDGDFLFYDDSIKSQALIELAPVGSVERAVPEALSNRAAARGDVRAPRCRQLRQGEGQ